MRCLQRGIPIAVVSSWLGHSDVNLTVKRYGRWSSEAREQWDWIKKLDEPVDSVAKGPWLNLVEDELPPYHPSNIRYHLDPHRRVPG